MNTAQMTRALAEAQVQFRQFVSILGQGHCIVKYANQCRRTIRRRWMTAKLDPESYSIYCGIFHFKNVNPFSYNGIVCFVLFFCCPPLNMAHSIWDIQYSERHFCTFVLIIHFCHTREQIETSVSFILCESIDTFEW